MKITYFGLICVISIFAYNEFIIIILYLLHYNNVETIDVTARQRSDTAGTAYTVET